MLVVGLTGGLGAGKSTVGKALAARGAVVIDTDEVAREILAPGTPGAGAVLAHFGPEVAGADGAIDRAALARRAFSSREGTMALEAITHPRIQAEVARRLSSARAAGTRLVVIEIPLLDAARRQRYELDLVVLVDASIEHAVARAVARGMAEQDARARMSWQPTQGERRSLADRVVVNNYGLAELDAEVDQLWEWLELIINGS